jgi:hypothetical protein
MLGAVAQATVDTGVITAAGWVVGGGGLLLTALWLDSLYRS